MYNPRSLNLKKKLATGALSPGLWVSLLSPTACEAVAGAGLDWVVVDAEHSPYNPETLLHILMAFNASSTVPLVRVAWNDPVRIKQALDMGWAGVLIPQVNTVEETIQAVEACRYPPMGKRGYGPRRAGNYYRDQSEYVRNANQAVICAIQIEDIRAAQEIDEIVKVPGLDWVMVGPNDMSATTERVFDLTNPDLWQTIQKIFDTARQAGLPTGNAVTGVKNIQKAVDMGCQLIILGEDTRFLVEAVDSALNALHEIESHPSGK
jgi:2-keto-3-deoxy-L-rhamnonate aldolase RhmA